jgi:hypothetical protein
MLGQFARNNLTFLGLEERHQAELFRRSADSVPGDPHAVGRAEFRSRFVLGELFGREDIFAIRLVVFGSLVVVVDVDNQLSVDRNRIVSLVVEIKPTTEAARRRLVRQIENSVGPNRRHARGSLRVFGHVERPNRFRLLKTDRLATTGECDRQ